MDTFTNTLISLPRNFADKHSALLRISGGLFVALLLITGCAGNSQQEPDKPARTVPAVTQYFGLQTIELCSGMSVDPRPSGSLHRRYTIVNGVQLLSAPVEQGCLSSGFGFRQAWGRYHKGVDYANRDGGPILAASEGVVMEATWHGDYGNMVLIKHSPSVYTRYAHLRSIQVTAQERVERGQKIGEMGRSGRATGVHLHYEILVDEQRDGGSPFNYSRVDPFDSTQIIASQ